MPTINRITNKEPLIEEKVNYFLDRITHVTEYAGWQHHLELESPTSLIEKVLFRLQNDKEFRPLYYDNFFSQDFFTKDVYWDKFPTYLPAKNIVTQYNLLGKSKRVEKFRLINTTTFQIDLLQLHRDLTHKMAEELMKGVINNVLCPHKLQELVPGSDQTHASFFNNVALLLVAEYFFRGFTRSEVRNIISRVFSKDVESFPFPPNVQTKKLRKKYLLEGTLSNQLHGFTHAFMQTRSKGIIMVKVYGGDFPDDFYFRYNKVKFFGKFCAQIKRIQSKMEKRDIEEFFGDGQYILAAAEIEWHSQHSLLENMAKLVRNELTFLSASLDRDFSVDTTTNYLHFSIRMHYKGMAWSSRNFNNKISATAIEQLNDNAYEGLRKIKGLAVDWFLKYEPLFVLARKNDSVSDYWLYLETLLSYNRPQKLVMGLVSSIILANEKLIRDKRILSTIYTSFSPFSGGLQLLNVTQERWRKVIPAIRKGILSKEIRAFRYPFIQELIHEYDVKLDPVYYKKAKDYYYRILTEAYEYRNFRLHSGLENEVSKEKLIATLPNIVIRLRWLLFHALRNGDHNTPFDLLLEKLSQQGELHLVK
jgi:hypothetical protein